MSDAAPRIILASASPRRAELLSQIGVRFDVAVADLDECVLAGEAPADYVCRLARQKAEAVWQSQGCPSNTWVLGSDTSVILDNQILGKPVNQEDCLATLMRLSGRTHQVMTAVALVGDARASVTLSQTQVQFRAISSAEAIAYWESGEPRDKAGSYGIQGKGGIFVERIEGSYSAVVGLPLFETAALLRSAGIELW